MRRCPEMLEVFSYAHQCTRLVPHEGRMAGREVDLTNVGARICVFGAPGKQQKKCMIKSGGYVFEPKHRQQHHDVGTQRRQEIYILLTVEKRPHENRNERATYMPMPMPILHHPLTALRSQLRHLLRVCHLPLSVNIRVGSPCCIGSDSDRDRDTLLLVTVIRSWIGSFDGDGLEGVCSYEQG